METKIKLNYVNQRYICHVILDSQKGKCVLNTVAVLAMLYTMEIDAHTVRLCSFHLVRMHGSCVLAFVRADEKTNKRRSLLVRSYPHP